jgi:peptide-methionine (S)-S-oxide reductase
MITRITRVAFLALLVAAVGALTFRLAAARDRAVLLPDPQVDAPLAASGDSTAVIAGGCFWGIQAVFQHVKGVKTAISGYAGGT